MMEEKIFTKEMTGTFTGLGKRVFSMMIMSDFEAEFEQMAELNKEYEITFTMKVKKKESL